MAVRIRKNGDVLCAASHPPEPGDIYLDDQIHGGPMNTNWRKQRSNRHGRSMGGPRARSRFHTDKKEARQIYLDFARSLHAISKAFGKIQDSLVVAFNPAIKLLGRAWDNPDADPFKDIEDYLKETLSATATNAENQAYMQGLKNK